MFFSRNILLVKIHKINELGIVIGMPTSGSVIGTGHYTFMVFNVKCVINQ
ncbi:MAG: hypothetical protein P9M11_06525 [Candidatus Tenebribacter burtonii]|nr:hypothetical protein [Candidatus Tenebribacter burtonii]